MRHIGQLSLLIAFIGTGYAAFACIVGSLNDHSIVRRSGIVAAVGSVIALSAAVAILVLGLLTSDFRFAYVASYSNRLLPWHYALSSLWVGQAGSLLLWAWFSGVLGLAFLFLPRRERSQLREPTFGVLMGFCCFLVAAMVFAADPMAPSIVTPRDGAGLSPLLQHPAMLIHPPIVFLGYSAWAIPFALAVTALATGQVDARWAKDARPWALFAWIVLGSGILLGAQWAYQELGWGGYWGWDPVENGSLIPWLIGTASIHAMMAWRQRGVLRKTAFALTIATFGMCNFATFLTRSGIFSSLHAFSQSSIGWLFLGLMIVLAVGGVFLIAVRRKALIPTRPVATLWCRESMIIVNTFALVALTVVMCAGTSSAAISEAILGHKIVVGVDFYNNALIPTGLVLLGTTALAPLLQWGESPRPAQRYLLWVSAGVGSVVGATAFLVGVRHPIWLVVAGLAGFSSSAFAAAVLLHARREPIDGAWVALVRSIRKRRREYAGFVIHMGLFCLAVGVTASSLGTRQHEAVMGEGETLEWSGRSIHLAKIVHRECPDKLIAEAQLELQSGSAAPAILTPAQHFHVLQNMWTSEVSIHSTWSGDFYTILHSGEGTGRVRMTFVENPMMRWIWVGGWTMVAGALVGLWPTRPSPQSRTLSPSRRSTVERPLRQRAAEPASSTLVPYSSKTPHSSKTRVAR